MPTTTTSLVPHIACRNAVQAVEFYQKAFGAKPEGIHLLPDGRLMHASLNIDGATFFVVDEFPEQGGKSPQALGGSPVMLSLHVPDCDALWNRAVAAGCEIRMPLQDMFWGDRWGLLVDPYGHQWSIATTIREVSPEELQQAMASMPECPQ
jgi:PhnB protein